MTGTPASEWPERISTWLAQQTEKVIDWLAADRPKTTNGEAFATSLMIAFGRRVHKRYGWRATFPYVCGLACAMFLGMMHDTSPPSPPSSRDTAREAARQIIADLRADQAAAATTDARNAQ